MKTTELISLLKSLEFGISGRPREISLQIGDEFLPEPSIVFDSSGDGCAGAELCLRVMPREEEGE